MEEREVVGAVDIDEGDAVAEFDRPRPGMLFEHFEGKEVKYILALYLPDILEIATYMKRDGSPCTAVSSEAWAKLRDWASVARRGRLLLSGSVAHASLKTAVI